MPSLDFRLLDTFESYIATNPLSKERCRLEEYLKCNKEWREHLDFFLDFEAEKEVFGRYLLKEELKQLDAELTIKFNVVDSG